MKRIDQTLAILLSGLTVTTGAWGAISENQAQSYQAIVQRNAFGLKPIPPPPEAKPPEDPPVNVVFTGITSMFGTKKAFFKIPDPKNPSQSLFPCLKEGERDGALEVLTIDENAGVVRIRNAGTAATLTFEKNGNKAQPLNAAGIPGASGVPGSLPVMGNPNQPRPGPLPVPGVNNPNPSFQIPPRPGANTGQDQNNLRTIPTRALRTQATPVPAVPNEQALVQSMINVEIQREMTKEQVARGEMPPLPPTDLSDPNGGGPNFPMPTPGVKPR